MKLTPEHAQTLTEILNAQANIKELPEAEYKEKRKLVEQYLNSRTGTGKDGQPRVYYTGGIKKEVYQDNKDNLELKTAAENHLKVAQNRKPQTSRSKPSFSHEEAANNVVKYLEAKTLWHKEGIKQLETTEARNLKNKISRWLDTKKGGLSNSPSPSFDGKSPWQALQNFPKVKEACKAHQEALKNPPKVPYIKEDNQSPQINPNQFNADTQEFAEAIMRNIEAEENNIITQEAGPTTNQTIETEENLKKSPPQKTKVVTELKDIPFN
jgi:hypothetical protein